MVDDKEEEEEAEVEGWVELGMPRESRWTG